MRILRLRAYCSPEITAAGHLVDDTEQALRDRGIININITPMPSRGVPDEVRREYKKRKLEVSPDGLKIIRRFPMFRERKNPLQRAFRYFLCSVTEYFYGIREKDIDLVHCGSTPPTQGMLSALVAKRLSKKYGRKVPFVYNLQDVFPDSMINAGITHEGSLLWKIGRKIETYTYRHADKIIVICESFREHVLAAGVPQEKIEYVSNWIDTEAVFPVTREDNRLFDEFAIDRQKYTVVYAGNFGAVQGADIVLKAAEELRDDPDIQFVIFGGGAYFEEAKRQAQSLDHVFIHELLPTERVSEVYSLGDVAVITGKAGTGKAGLPSKVWSILACNTPIIASFDTDSDLAGVINDSGCGVCIAPERTDLLVGEIRKQKTDHGISGQNGRAYVMQNADKNRCVGRYVDILCEVCKKDG